MLSNFQGHRKVKPLVERNRLLEIYVPDIEMSRRQGLRPNPRPLQAKALVHTELLCGCEPGSNPTPKVDDRLWLKEIEDDRKNSFRRIE